MNKQSQFIDKCSKNPCRCVDYLGIGQVFSRYLFHCPRYHVFIIGKDTCVPGKCSDLQGLSRPIPGLPASTPAPQNPPSSFHPTTSRPQTYPTNPSTSTYPTYPTYPTQKIPFPTNPTMPPTQRPQTASTYPPTSPTTQQPQTYPGQGGTGNQVSNFSKIT